MRNTNTDQFSQTGDVRVQEFLDMIAPSVVKFNASSIESSLKLSSGQTLSINPDLLDGNTNTS